MPFKSELPGKWSLPARTIPGSPNVDGSGRRISDPATDPSLYPRLCAWCGVEFVPKTRRTAALPPQRFCDRSCSAKWRMSQPEYVAKVHTPEVRAKRGKAKRAWFAAGSPQALAQVERIRRLNPTNDPEVRAKISRTLKAMNHGPSVRGGNGTGLTEPERRMLDALGSNWQAGYAISLGRRKQGYPSNYKVDLAWVDRRLAIEADGFSHCSRRALDEKKDAMLGSLGWTVLRFSNQEILDWIDGGMPKGASISTTLEQHGIHPSR